MSRVGNPDVIRDLARRIEESVLESRNAILRAHMMFDQMENENDWNDEHSWAARDRFTESRNILDKGLAELDELSTEIAHEADRYE